MRKLVIERSRWDRGRGAAASPAPKLLGEKGMCCLGFLAKSCGYTNDEIRGEAMPRGVYKKTSTDLFENITNVNAWDQVWEDIAVVNDDISLKALDRERKIKQMMRDRLGVAVRFVD